MQKWRIEEPIFVGFIVLRQISGENYLQRTTVSWCILPCAMVWTKHIPYGCYRRGSGRSETRRTTVCTRDKATPRHCLQRVSSRRRARTLDGRCIPESDLSRRVAMGPHR